MRRPYLHAANEFTLNTIQTGGGFGSHPSSLTQVIQAF